MSQPPPYMHPQPGFQQPQGPPGPVAPFKPPTGQLQLAPRPTFPLNLPIYTDPEIIKEQATPCMVRCPNCGQVGLSVITTSTNICLFLLGIPTLVLLGLGAVFMYLSFERTHVCSHCSATLGRKKNCC